MLVYILSNVAVLLLLLASSALISGSEVAFFSIGAHELKEFSKSKPESSEYLVANLLGEPKKLLATILVANNLINVAIVTLCSFATWTFAGTKDLDPLTATVSSLVVTFLIVFFGEVVPKVYADKKKLAFAVFMAKPLSFLNKLFLPISSTLRHMTGYLERKVGKRGFDVSMDELHKALEMTTSKTTPEEKEILKGIVNFGTINVTQVMCSRMDLTAFDLRWDFHQLMDKVNKSGFSRVPVYRDTVDKIEGILYVKDLLPFIDQDESFRWQSLLRPAFFIPESKRIDQLLKNFQEKRVHMAVVIDEYGGTSGLVTLEDVIEEIVGEINDEFDEEAIDFRKLSDNVFSFEAKTSLNDFCKVLDLRPDEFDEVKGDSESLGGLLLELYEGMPNVSEEVPYKQFLFVIEAATHKRLKRIKVIVNNVDSEEENG